MKLYVDDEPLLLATPTSTTTNGPSTSEPGSLTASCSGARPAASGCASARSGWCQPRAPPPRGDAHRGHAARRFGPDRDLLAAAQPPRRRGRVPRPSAALGEERRRTRGGPASSTGGSSILRRRSQHDDDTATPDRRRQVTLGYRCANSGMTIACGYRHVSTPAATTRSTTVVEPRPREVGVHRSRPTPDETIRSRSTSATTRHAGFPCDELADRCTANHRPSDRARASTSSTPSSDAWLDRVLANSDVEIDGDDGRATGDPVEPVPARPGLGTHPRAGHRGQGRHRRRLRRPLLLGHRGVRPAVPGVHQPERGTKAAALPLPHARRGARTSAAS